MRWVPVVVALTALLGGCAVGQKISYQDVTPALLARAQLPLAIAVQDQRPEIAGRKRGPQFVGLMRGGYGNTFDVETASGKPLADDVAFAISRGLARRGFTVRSTPVAPFDDPTRIVATLASTGASRVVVIQLSRWKSDTYMSTQLVADVTARVLEVATARELGASRVAGARNLGSSFWDPPGYAKSVLPAALRETLEQLLNAPAIVNALGVTPALGAGGTPSPPANAGSGPAQGASLGLPSSPASGTAPGGH